MSVRSARPADLNVIRTTLETHARTEAGFARDDDAPDELERVLFGKDAFVQVAIAERPGEEDPFAGLAMWYRTFSSWARTSGIWLEDLYVVDRHRSSGVGRELMSFLRTQTHGRIEYDVTDGNVVAERFYRRLGARPVADITRYRWLIVGPTAASKR